MEEKTCVIYQITATLASITEEALQLERELSKSREQEDLWYRKYTQACKELDDTKGRLAAEIENHENTRQALRDYLEMAKKDKEAE